MIKRELYKFMSAISERTEKQYKMIRYEYTVNPFLVNLEILVETILDKQKNTYLFILTPLDKSQQIGRASCRERV